MDEQGDFWGLLFLLTFHQDKLATVHPKLALNICWPIDVALALYFIDGPAEYLSADGTLPSQNLPAVKVACDQRAAVSSKRHSSPEEEGEVGPQLGNGPAPWCVSRRPLGLRHHHIKSYECTRARHSRRPGLSARACAKGRPPARAALAQLTYGMTQP